MYIYLSHSLSIHIYIYICICTYQHTYTYIYIYIGRRERERERERERYTHTCRAPPQSAAKSAQLDRRASFGHVWPCCSETQAELITAGPDTNKSKCVRKDSPLKVPLFVPATP